MTSLLGSIFRILQQIFCQQGGQQEQQVVQSYQQQQGQGPLQENYTPKDPPKHHNNHGHQPPHAHQGHKPDSLIHNVEHQRHYPHRNENLINQNNEHYKRLRARAHEEGEAMARCFEEGHRAYEAGDGARAKKLSNEGHVHQREMNNLNAQASDWIYKANNTDSGPGEIDLHGLYVKEAITHTERAIQEAQSRGDVELRLIVGKGLHSPDHVAKLEPAIEDLMRKYNLAAHLDEHNSGVLVVALDGQPRGHTLGSGEITRRLGREDEDCVVM